MWAARYGFAASMLGGCAGQVTDTFDLDADVDVLFAIDKSGSMDDDARRLGDAFGDFIDEVGAVTENWQIGVVTTDSGCFNNGILDADTEDYEDRFLDAVTRDTWVDPSTTEALLAMVDAALTQTGPSGCNTGFVRSNALLHVVTVSDEKEQSGRSADYWVGRWQDRMDDPERLVISAIVDPNGSCGGDASGYLDAVDATGGLVLDLCTRAWPSFATELGQASVEDLRVLSLSRVPKPTSIRVEIDGDPFDDWRYEASENAVVLDEDVPSGSSVVIQYRGN